MTLTCVTSCLSREFFDTNRVCQTCDSTCLTCVGTALACTSCTGTRYLEGNTCTKLCSLGLFGVASSHECLSDCEDYFFQHDVDRLCYLICPSGFYGNVFTKKCVASCPDGMYNDPLTIRCEYCDFNCLTCSGSTKNCLICKYSWLVGFFCNSPSCMIFLYFIKIILNLIVTNSLDSDVFIINPMTNLDITSLGFTINNSFTSNYANDCSPYYIIGGPGTFGSSSSIQKSYNSIPAHFRVRITFFFLKIDNWNNNKLIVTVDGVSIPTNLLFSSNMDSTVRKLCGTTSIPEALRPVDLIFSHNSSNLDLIITTDLTAAASQASWGIYKLSLTFDKCSLYCKTCQSFSSYDCLSCIPGLILQNNSGPSTCQSICPDGFYSDIITNTCSACNLLCSKCLGPSSNECITCPTGTLLLFAGSTSQCVSKCPNTHFENSDRVCQLCDSKCKTCFGTYSNCLTCSLPDYFIDNNCVSICPGNYFGDNSTATCVKNCPKPNFPYAVTKICVPCYNDCLECIGFGSNECTLCNSNKMFEEGSCVSSCSANHFLNVANSSCEGIKI